MVLRIRRSEIEGIGLFQTRQEVVWEKQGVVLVAGQEGAGKTTLKDSLCVALFDKGAPRLGATAFTHLTATNDFGLRHLVDLEASGHEVQVLQTGGSKGNSLDLRVDGIRDDGTGVGSRAAKRRRLHALLGLTRDEWLGSVYLSQHGTHDLFAGSDGKRTAYITRAFGLAFYRDLLDAALAEKKTLEATVEVAVAAQAKLASIRDSIKESRDELASLPDPAAQEAAVAEAEKALLDATQALGALKQRQEQGRALSSARDQLQALLPKPADPKEALAAARARRAELARVLGDLEVQQEKRSRAEKKLAQAKKAVGDVVLPDLSKVPSLENLEAAVALFQEFPEYQVPPEEPVEPAENPNWRKHRTRGLAEQVNLAKLKKLRKTECSECPTCLSPVSLETLDDVISSTQEKASALLLSARQGFLHEVSLLTGKRTYAKVTAGLATRREHTTLSASLLAAQGALKSAQEAVDALPPPEDESSLREEDEALRAEVERLGKVEKRLSKITVLEGTAARLEQAGAASPDPDDLVKAAGKQEVARKRHADEGETRQEITRVLTRIETLGQQEQKQVSECAKHVRNAMRSRVLETEVIPFTKALLTGKVHQAIGKINEVLPVYVGTVATEQYVGAEVRLSTSDDLKSIDLEVRTKEAASWGPPLNASGGQQQRFTLALVGAIVESSPHKVNMLWLDEPLKNLQREGKFAVAYNFIPTLRERNPHLESVFIAAHDREVLEGPEDVFDDVWIVENDGIKSTLTTGRRKRDLA